MSISELDESGLANGVQYFDRRTGADTAVILNDYRRALWRDLKKQEAANIQRVKQMIADEVRQNCF